MESSLEKLKAEEFTQLPGVLYTGIFSYLWQHKEKTRLHQFNLQPHQEQWVGSAVVNPK